MRGRPKNPVAKIVRVNARITKEESYWLKLIMEKTGKTKSEALAYSIRIVYNLLK